VRGRRRFQRTRSKVTGFSTSGYNQDLGLALDGNIVGWKESGGYAGTFSPNAAYVETVVPLSSGSHTATLLWKTNRRAASATVFAAAGGAIPF